jgi:hypothetical protein
LAATVPVVAVVPVVVTAVVVALTIVTVVVLTTAVLTPIAISAVRICIGCRSGQCESAEQQRTQDPLHSFFFLLHWVLLVPKQVHGLARFWQAVAC